MLSIAFPAPRLAAALLGGVFAATALGCARRAYAPPPSAAASTEAEVLVRVPGSADEPAEAPPVGQTGRPPITMMAAGNDHTCALTEGGAVYCWGSNRRGQLGELGPESPVPAAVPGLPPMAAVWAGGDATCARTLDDAQLFCWGQTGLGGPRGFAQALPYRGVRSVEVGPGERGCFLDAEGALYCWGEFWRTEWEAPTRVDLDHVTSVALGWLRGCAVHNDGRASCWGQRRVHVQIDFHRRGSTWSFVGLDDISEMAFYEGPQSLPIILDTDGNVQVTYLGPNRHRFTSEAVLAGRVLPGLSDVVQLSVGDLHACARTSAGVAGCWGSNSSGQLGDGSEARSRDEPRLLPLSGVQEVVAGGRHSCARTATELYCWGSNQNGQLGVEGLRGTRDPQQIPW